MMKCMLRTFYGPLRNLARKFGDTSAQDSSLSVQSLILELPRVQGKRKFVRVNQEAREFESSKNRDPTVILRVYTT